MVMVKLIYTFSKINLQEDKLNYSKASLKKICPQNDKYYDSLNREYTFLLIKTTFRSMYQQQYIYRYLLQTGSARKHPFLIDKQL